MKPKMVTKEEFENFLKQQDNLIELIKFKTTELAMIMYNKPPEGEYVEFDIEESEFEPGCIFVEYVTPIRCDTPNVEQYNLPFEFLYDENYPKKYKEEFENKKQLREQQRKLEKQKEEKRKQEALEIWERNELERLKNKYGCD